MEDWAAAEAVWEAECAAVDAAAADDAPAAAKCTTAAAAAPADVPAQCAGAPPAPPATPSAPPPRPRRSAAQWSTECRRQFDAVATLAVLFAVRSAPLFVHSVAETVSQQSSGRGVFDFTTLQALAQVHPSLVSWVEERESDGVAAPPIPTSAVRVRIVVAFEANGDSGGVKGNATVGAVRARKNPKTQHTVGGHDGMSALLNQARQGFAARCDALAVSLPVDKLPPLCAAEVHPASSARRLAEAGESSGWPRGVPVTAENFLSFIQSAGLGGVPYSGQLASVLVLAARHRRLADVPARLSVPVRQAVAALHPGQILIYTHQAAAVDSILDGNDTVVTTSTASGKSLIYTLAIAECFHRDPSCRFLLLFPTKALAHDQRLRLVSIFEQLAPGLKVAAIDGDTPHVSRESLVRESQVLLTNPDLLHFSVLPQHKSSCWAEFLGRLRLVVIDELHYYHGVFGTHIALLMRRLRRLCTGAAGPPLFIGCSATLANAAEHFRTVAGSLKAVTVVSSDGSPCGRKEFALWNPPIIHDATDAEENEHASGDTTRMPNTALQKSDGGAREFAPSSDIGWGAVHGPRRSSSVNEAADLLALLIIHRIRCLAFVRARNVCELLLRKTQERLPASLQSQVAAYRAGYTAGDRRQIESDLRSGRVIGVVATNALELGIDIGGIAATLHLGYPGSSAALCQQMGRAGRGVEDSLAIMIALDAPLDQSFVAAAATVAEGEASDGTAGLVLQPTAAAHATTDLSNPTLLAVHLGMAAAESPLDFGGTKYNDVRGFGVAGQAVATCMAADGRLQQIDRRKSCYHPVPQSARAKVVGLRGMGNCVWRVVHNSRVLEEVEEARALETLFPGAILVHRGGKYIVCEQPGSSRAGSGSGCGLKPRVDVEVQVERCSQAVYYTEAQAIAEVCGTEAAVGVASRPLIAVGHGGKDAITASCCHGPVVISKTVHSYRRRRAIDRKIMDSVELFQQPAKTETHAWWLRLPLCLEKEVHGHGWSFERGGLHAVEHALIAVAPAFARLESSEIGCQCRRLDMIGPATKHLLVHEKHSGGVGLAAQLAECAELLLKAGLQLIEGCLCENGCPNCIHMERCEELNQRLDKVSGAYLLRRILGASSEQAVSGLRHGEAIGAEPGPPAWKDVGRDRLRNPLDS